VTIAILDPTHEAAAAPFAAAPRLSTLAGTTIAIVSNGKKNTAPFFDAFARELVERHQVAEIVRLTKSNYSAPVETGLLDEAQKWNALVAGIGD
jgi:hypothetical protein